MDAEERKALFIRARAEAYEVSLARHSVMEPAEPEPEPEPEPAPAPARSLTTAEIMALVDSKIAAAFEARAVGDDALRDAIGGALGEIRAQVRKEFADELTKLDLKFSGLLHEVSLKQTVESAQRERDAVIDLPVLPLRSQRRA